MERFLGLSQGDHALGKVEPADPRRAAMPDQPGVEPLPAGQVQDAEFGGVADEAHQREALDERSPRLLLGSLVLLGDRVVIGRHDGLRPNRLRRGAIAIHGAATL